MPDDVVAFLLYLAGAIVLLLGVWRGASAWGEARARKVRGGRALGEERLKAYAAMVGAGMPPAAVDAAFAVPRPPSPQAPVAPGPVPPATPVAPLPDPHLLERIRALEAKVSALEAQVGAPAATELAGMRAPPPPGPGPSEAPRPAGLRAFP